MRRPSSIGALNSPNKQVVTRSLEYNARGEVQCNQPCRPNTTPKPRIQRLLLGPGQNVTHDQTFQNQLKAPLPSKLTYLPDSPPRFQFIDVTDLDNPQSSEAPCEVEQVLSNSKIIAECFESDYGEYRQENLPLEALTPSSGNSDKRLENEELDLSRESVAMKTEKVDVDTYETRDQESNNDVGKIADDDEEYKQALANRGRLLINEANRQRTRSELESYVGSLKAMIDEDGEQLVQFPKNYQQVVSLMTQKDIREGDTASNQDKQTHLNWSRVLIDSGLSKQQAFGIIEEVDDDPECKSKLAAKIALKMARIRQLDTVLEEKLGKNLYANIAPRKQKALRRKGMKKGVRTSNLSSRTFMTQAQSAAPSETLNCGQTSRSTITTNLNMPSCDEGEKKSNNFIERNKQIIANGLKANMTKQEEERLEKLLLYDDVSSMNDSSHGDDARPESDLLSQDCNEYTMPINDKIEIEELIATQSVKYPLYVIDEAPLDDCAMDNIIQTTKRERLQKQRLSRVEHELRFFQQCPSVVIVDDDCDENNHDDCYSEQSYATATSSMCSTRSGVISRHDFKRFLAQQKETFNSTPSVSPDEIRQLLLTISHGKHDVVSATTV